MKHLVRSPGPAPDAHCLCSNRSCGCCGLFSVFGGGEQGHGGVILGRSTLESTLSQDEKEIISVNTFQI